MKTKKNIIRTIAKQAYPRMYSFAYKIIFFLVFSTMALSCKSKWKKSTSAQILIEMDKVSNSSYMEFTGGQMLINEVSFSGERKQGEDVSFEYPLDYTKVDFTYGNINPPIIFDIPQGTYSSIEIEMETREGVGEPSILLLGTYKSSSGEIIPLRFEFNSSETFEMEAEAEDGGEEIVLIEDIPTKAKIIISPGYLFTVVSQKMMEEASHTTISGVPTILISTSSNEDIYDIIVDRIDDASEAIFY